MSHTLPLSFMLDIIHCLVSNFVNHQSPQVSKVEERKAKKFRKKGVGEAKKPTVNRTSVVNSSQLQIERWRRKG